jgi:hypothetical protein
MGEPLDFYYSDSNNGYKIECGIGYGRLNVQ